LNPVNLSTISSTSLGYEFGASATGVPNSLAWGTANRAIFIPFTLPYGDTVKRLWVINGTVVSGNLDMGIYTYDGGTSATLLVAIGGAAQTGTSVCQYFDVTDTWLPTGKYYFAFVLDNTTGAVMTSIPATVAFKTFGHAQMSTAYPLPSTATLVATTTNRLVFQGLSFLASP
jgi:hypothetical protein